MEERKAAGLAMVVRLAKWLTGFAEAWTGLLLVVLATALAGGVNGWALLSCAGFAGAAALSFLRVHMYRWSWPGFAAALAAHGLGLAVCPEEALLVPAVEVLVLTALLAAHIAWSVLTRGRKEGGCGEEG